jgi:hypothetical protein
MAPIDFTASRGVQNPMSVPKPGFYKATIAAANMKLSANSGEMYLNVQYKLRDNAGQNSGTIFDGLFDPGTPAKAALQYKLGQFMKAAGLTTLAKGELTDIQKLITGRELIVDVKNTTGRDGKLRGEVDPFTRGGYFPMSNWADCYAMDGGVSATLDDTTDVPFTMDEPVSPEAAKPIKDTPPPPPPAGDDEF